MKLQIRKTDGPVCKDCGSTELIFIPTTNEKLEKELLFLLADDPPWYRPFKRRWQRGLSERIEKGVGELRQQTLRV